MHSEDRDSFTANLHEALVEADNEALSKELRRYATELGVPVEFPVSATEGEVPVESFTDVGNQWQREEDIEQVGKKAHRQTPPKHPR